VVENFIREALVSLTVSLRNLRQAVSDTVIWGQHPFPAGEYSWRPATGRFMVFDLMGHDAEVKEQMVAKQTGLLRHNLRARSQ
jgi:hypothetical protein